jgi:hypothetical protein
MSGCTTGAAAQQHKPGPCMPPRSALRAADPLCFSMHGGAAGVCCAERAQALPDADIETRMSLLQRQMKLGDACTFRLIAKNVVSLLPASEAELKELTMTELENLIRRAGPPAPLARQQAAARGECLVWQSGCWRRMHAGVVLRGMWKVGAGGRGERLCLTHRKLAPHALQLLQAWSSASHIANTLTLAVAQH